MSAIAFGLNYDQQAFTNHGAAIRRIPTLITGARPGSEKSTTFSWTMVEL
jgi:hypothetical protein